MIIEQIFGQHSLTDSEKQIVSFIESNPRAVIDFPLDELAEKCFVSQASIIRFCKKLGTKGFADFKIKLASRLDAFVAEGKDIHLDMPIPKEAQDEQIADILFSLSSQSLKLARSSIDFPLLKRAALMLSRADLIHIYGRGESLILAEDFHYKLTRIGKHSSLETLNGFAEAKCLLANKKLNQVAIVVSHYCNNRQVHYVIDELTNAKVPFILVTATDNAWPYEQFALATLRVPCSESLYKMGSFSSRTAMQYLLDCLYCLVFSLDYDVNAENLARFSQRKLERGYFYDTSGTERRD